MCLPAGQGAQATTRHLIWAQSSLCRARAQALCGRWRLSPNLLASCYKVLPLSHSSAPSLSQETGGDPPPPKEWEQGVSRCRVTSPSMPYFCPEAGSGQGPRTLVPPWT